jgi:hypothetical protein
MSVFAPAFARSFRLVTAALTALLVALAGLVAVTSAAPAGAADAGRPDGADPPPTVSADPLPTVQVDGVVWAQVTVTNTGNLTLSDVTLRPARSSAGRVIAMACDASSGQPVDRGVVRRLASGAQVRCDLQFRPGPAGARPGSLDGLFTATAAPPAPWPSLTATATSPRRSSP